jgi:ABC-2 type transport system ATP-binding protein
MASSRELAVRAESLTKRFGDVVAVDDLSFELEQGTITGFLGPNGAGKTTTLRMVVGLVAPTSGRALVFGRPYVELANPSRRVGAALEAADFHPGRSGRDHLRMLADAVEIQRSRVEEVLRLVELEGAGGRRVKTYSLGMRQRLGLAAALLGDPELLILDEPANGLDPAGVRWLRDFLRDFAAGQRTVLISSHVLAEVAQTVDDVLIINHGRLVTEAPLGELTGRTVGTVHVRTPDPARLEDALTQAGIRVSTGHDHALRAYGTTVEQVGDVAFGAGVPIHELGSDNSSLEEVFLRLTTEQAA